MNILKIAGLIAGLIAVAASATSYGKDMPICCGEEPSPKKIIYKGEGGAQVIFIDTTRGKRINYDRNKAVYISATGKEFELEHGSGISWGEGKISTKLRYLYVDTMFPYPDPNMGNWRNYCPIFDFRTGCIVYVMGREECDGKWESDSIWSVYPYDTHSMKINASEYKGPQSKDIWLGFATNLIDDKELKISSAFYDMPPETVQNTLVCDHINSENLAYYKLIKQQLKNEKNKDYKLIQKAIKEADVTSDKVTKQIISKKAALYNTPRNKDKSSAYLVAGDSVVIVDESKIKRGWYEISYISKTGKILNKWIHAADIAGNSNIKTLADEPEVKKKEEDFGGEKTLFSCRYAMIDSIDHKPLAFVKYKIKRADGSIEKGVTDKHGYTRPLKMGKEGKKEYIYLNLDYGF